MLSVQQRATTRKERKGSSGGSCLSGSPSSKFLSATAAGILTAGSGQAGRQVAKGGCYVNGRYGRTVSRCRPQIKQLESGLILVHFSHSS